MRLFAELFPRPERESQKRALNLLVEIHDRQCEELDRSLGIARRTSPEGRELIRELVEAL
jgi:hypothetical protein